MFIVARPAFSAVCVATYWSIPLSIELGKRGAAWRANARTAPASARVA